MRASGPFVLFGGVVLCLLSCAGRFDPAHFDGTREPQRAEPESLRELAASTSELEPLGRVRASCSARSGFRRLDQEALSDVDCSTERLRRALRESAARAGGEALIDVACSSQRSSSNDSELVSCSADVARYRTGELASLRPLSVLRATPQGRPAPSPSDVLWIDEPDASLAFRIWVSFTPALAEFKRPARRGAEVRELPRLPLTDAALGELVASCDGECEERALRYGVLVAAGRLGAPDVVAVRCFRSGSRQSCVGTLAAPERDE